MTPSYPKVKLFCATPKKVILLAFVTFSFFNCKDKKEKTEEILKEAPIEAEMAVSPTLETGCYWYHENGNMVNLEITNNDNPVAANLTYAYAEKDKNTAHSQENLTMVNLFVPILFNRKVWKVKDKSLLCSKTINW